jgi:hypothetical protein
MAEIFMIILIWILAIWINYLNDRIRNIEEILKNGFTRDGKNISYEIEYLSPYQNIIKWLKERENKK